MSGPKPSGSDANILALLFAYCSKNYSHQNLTHFVNVVRIEPVLYFDNSGNFPTKWKMLFALIANMLPTWRRFIITKTGVDSVCQYGL